MAISNAAYLGAQLGSSLLGGVLGSAAQSSANKVNLQINRENNLFNANQAMLQRNFEERMMREQMKYNSPASQRKMAEEAGFNPLDVYGNIAGVSAGSGASASSASPLGVSPVTALPNAVSSGLSASAEVARLMSETEKNNKETENIDLQNKVFMKQKELEFKALGLQNVWQEFENQYQKDTLPFRIKGAALTNDIMIANMDLTKEQAKQVTYQNFLTRFFGVPMQAAQLNKLIAEVDNIMSDKHLKDKQYEVQEALKGYYHDAGKAQLISAAANMINANTYASLAPANREYLQACALSAREQAKVNSKIAEYKANENAIYNFFGFSASWYELEMLKNKAHASEAEWSKAVQEVQKNHKDLSMYDFNVIKDIIGLGIFSKLLFGRSSSGALSQPEVMQPIQMQAQPVFNGTTGPLLPNYLPSVR